MADKTLTIKNYYPRDIPIDDEDLASEMLPIRIRRFTVAQLKEFQRGFERVMNPLSARFIYRKQDSDEQATQDDGNTFVIGPAEIKRRRESEMSPETAAEYARQSEADDTFALDFSSKAITDHVWVAPNVKLSIEDDAGATKVVTDGAGLVEAFGGNLSFLIRITKAIHEENTMTPEAKKAWRSLSTSITSSQQPKGDGGTPAATATSADNSDSVKSAAASAAPDPIPSGLDGLVM